MSLESTILTIVGGAVALLVFLGLIVYGVKRWRSQSDPSRDESGTDTIDNEDFKRGTVSLKTRLSSWQRTGQIAALAMIALFFLTGYVVWTFAKTGSPNEFVMTTPFQIFVVGLFIAGVSAKWGSNKPDLARLELEIEQQDADEKPITKTIWFDPSDTDADEDSHVVFEYLYQGPWGIFSRPKRVAESRILRGESGIYAADEDKVAWELPSYAIEHDGDIITVRTSDIGVVTSKSRVANLELVPPRRKSPRQFRKAYRERKKLQNKIEELGALCARQGKRIEHLQETVDQDNSQARDEIAEILQLLNQMTGNITHVDNHLSDETLAGRASRDGAGDVLDDFGVDEEQLDGATS